MENRLQYVIYALVLSSLFWCTSCNEEEKVSGTDEEVTVQLSVDGVIESVGSEELGKRSSDDEAPVQIVRPFGEHHHLVGTFEKEETKTPASRAAQKLETGVKCRFFAYNVDRGTIDQSVDFTVGGAMPILKVAQGVKYLFYAYSYHLTDGDIEPVDATGAPDLLLIPFEEGTGELLYWIDPVGERTFTSKNTNTVKIKIGFRRACCRIKVKLYGDGLQVNSGSVELKLQSRGLHRLRDLIGPASQTWQDVEPTGGSVRKDFNCSLTTEATAEFFLIPQELNTHVTFSLSNVWVAGYDKPKSADIKLNHATLINSGYTYTFGIKIVPNS